MSKPRTRTFSIFLLKDGQTAETALKDEHDLASEYKADALPEGGTLWIKKGHPKPPWWKGYFKVEGDLNQAFNGALIFLPVGKRLCALTFGATRHALKDTAYEYDFGIRATLNCVDPEQLKSMDGLEPSGGRRRRTQVAAASELTAFDFDQDSTLLKSLTGKVRDEHKELFKSVTGSDNVRVSAAIDADGLVALCTKLIELYGKEDFKTNFPDLQNVSPVRDPAIIAELDEKLVVAVKAKEDSVVLTVPEIVDYSSALWAVFQGAGYGKQYDDVSFENYTAHLADRGQPLADIDLAKLKSHSLQLAEDDGTLKGDKQSIYKCFIFDTKRDGLDAVYHLCEGNWYEVNEDFVASLQTYLDPFCVVSPLPDYAHANEGDYNSAVAAAEGLACLDKKDISPKGQSQIEPCDLFSEEGGIGTLFHIKRKTDSSSLSHLFNQGTNSIHLLRDEDSAVAKLKTLLTDHSQEAVDSVNPKTMKVVFGIVTHKDPDEKSKNLPFFSRISLMRIMKDMKRMGVEAAYCFISDTTDERTAKKRKRPKKPAENDNVEDPTDEAA